ncbi:hypothetical protein [Mesorhizobium sp. SP-1A]|uniref:hypothetical protein n=1 Tax=Mesorhizobium sp. SP-1A TaxID=3077840 RepID=UPI0028F6E7E2|nr:hypothetical protein [Mesorhizobium sp. SP-1A]
MTLSKSLRIALIAAVGCLGLSIPPTSQAENLTNEEIAEQLGFETYDTRFMERLSGMVLTNLCTGFGMDVYYSPFDAWTELNCAVDRGYILVPRHSYTEIYRDGQLLFSVDTHKAQRRTLRLEFGTLADLAKFKEAFKLDDKKFAVELD